MEHPDCDEAVPTPDHFIPLLYLAGLAAAANEPAEAVIRGYSMGSISMTSYGLGTGPHSVRNPEGSAGLPRDVPPEQTNV